MISHSISNGCVSLVDIVVMAAFAWCGPNQLDAYKVLELLPIRGRWNWNCGDLKERLSDSVSTLSQAKKRSAASLTRLLLRDIYTFLRGCTKKP
jgi:hypothetical protein